MAEKFTSEVTRADSDVEDHKPGDIWTDREGGHWGVVGLKSGLRLVSTDWLRAGVCLQLPPSHPLRVATAIPTFGQVDTSLGPLTRVFREAPESHFLSAEGGGI